MNLALFDIDVLAEAMVDALQGGDTAGLENYSDTCLRRLRHNA
jgi:p-hydroxybenzoate 3-monooxygenase